MRTRRYALHERIRAKEFQLKEVLRRLDRQRLLEMFPVGIHPDTPLQFRSSGSTVFIDAPLTAIVSASQRVWQVDPSPVPDPVGGFQDITIPELNVDATLLDDEAVDFSSQSPGTYIVYAAHKYSEEHAESRQPPGIFADGAGVNPTHRDFFDHEHQDGTAIPREAYDPSLTPTTVSEIADRLTVSFAREGSVPPGVAELVRVALSSSGTISAVSPVFRYSDVTDIRTVEDRVNAHIGVGGDAHPVASPTVAGFMSAADKTKLNNSPANTSNALANKADIVGGRIPNSQLPTSGTANRVLKVGAANSNPVYGQVDFNELTGTIAGGQIPAGGVADSKISGISASKVSGVLDDGNIPNLSAGKVTSDTFHPNRVSALFGSGGTAGTNRVNIDATRINTGLLSSSQIPNLDTSRVTSGTFHPNRVSGLFGSGGTPGTNRVNIDATRITGTLDAARLPVGATNNTQVAPGQALTGYGDARHPVGSIRFVGIESSTVPAGGVYSNVRNGSLSVVSGGSGPPVLSPGVSSGTLPGTWQALNDSAIFAGNYSYALAVRFS